MAELKCYDSDRNEITSVYQNDASFTVYIGDITVMSGEDVYFDFSIGRCGVATPVEASYVVWGSKVYYAAVPSSMMERVDQLWIHVVRRTSTGERVTIGRVWLDIIKTDCICDE